MFADNALKLVLKVGGVGDTPESIVSEHSGERKHKHKMKKKNKSSDKDKDRHHHKHDRHHHRDKGDEDSTSQPSEEAKEQPLEEVVPKTEEKPTVEKENVVKETTERKVYIICHPINGLAWEDVNSGYGVVK